jgi:hypothetical protein
MEAREKEKILKEALMINISATWYQTEIKKVINRIQELEPSIDYDSEASKEYKERQGQLSYLLGKGLFENRLIRLFKKRIRLIK